jgi:DNA helicase-2/ATP-dependent DNA helicase PcrA
MPQAMTKNEPNSYTPPYLAGLNPEQRLAVETTEGPVLVLAGAGTGKTRVLTTRIAHILLTKRAFPSQILAVTFTNKAAAEMRERVEKLMQEGADAPASPGLWLGTFHSIGVKILRRHAEAVGLTSNFTILDDDDQQRLLKQLMADRNIDNTKAPTKYLLNIIQSWKDRGLVPEKIPSPHTMPEEIAAHLYPAYQDRLRTLNACDFGDLLLHCLTIFQKHPEICQEYAQRFRYILVDEYQDTNVAQYMWLRLLAIAHKNLCCVGDDDQSIYGWRGADVGNILKFEEDFPGATIIRLERNYRSTAPILKAASGLIANNSSRLGKTLWTELQEGEKIRIKSVWDDNEEARFVGEEIEAFQRDRIPLSQMAVLVRAGFQTRGFEERFLTLGIPYRVIGGLRFYERREIRDAVAYLRIISQPHDDLAFERIINTPKRGIGDKTLEQLHTTARYENCSLSDAIAKLLANGGLKGKTAATLDGLMKQFARWRRLLPSPLAGEGQGGGAANLAPTAPNAAPPPPNLLPQGEEALSVSALTDLMLDESGYRAMWQADKSPESTGRLENLKELVRALADFPSLTDFLEHVGLVTDGGNQTGSDMVNIMSFHAAKGLEFRAVFLTGWEEGLFPSQRTMDEKGTTGLEEERRLAYVGITRAREHLLISHAANRRMYNEWKQSIPSRFLAELPRDTLAEEDAPATRRAAGPALFQREMEAILAGRVDMNMREHQRPNSGFAHAPSQQPGGLRKGSRVVHASFGNGVVLNIEGDHVQVAFKHAGVKKLLKDYITAE